MAVFKILSAHNSKSLFFSVLTVKSDCRLCVLCRM